METKPADSDGDGVADEVDKCPDTPSGTAVDGAGCPEKSAARGVLEGVTCEFGSAELTEGSKAKLSEVAETLKQFPEVKVEVQGHTDNSGDPNDHRMLSQQRADSVKNYLIDSEGPAERLTSKGYGPDQPREDNATREGRKANRRVELKWLDE